MYVEMNSKLDHNLGFIMMYFDLHHYIGTNTG